MTAKQIELLLTRDMFKPFKNIVLPNVATGPVLGEADLLVLRPSDWLEEIEIKVDFQDFKREFTADTKQHKHKLLVNGIKGKPHTIKRFWYAVSSDIATRVTPLIPAHAGLIVAHRRLEVVKAAPNLKMARKLTPQERIALLEKAYYRYWRFRGLGGEDALNHSVEAA